MNTNTFSPPQDNKKSRRSRGVLAGLTILGLGAAITTAAFTDDVLFQTGLDVAAFRVQGAVTTTDTTPGEGDWINADRDPSSADFTFELPNQPWRAGEANSEVRFLWLRDASGAAVTATTGTIAPTAVTGLAIDLDTWTTAGTYQRAELTVTATGEIEAGAHVVTIPVTVTGVGTVPTPAPTP